MHYAESVSRLASFYVFEDVMSAERAMRRWSGSFRKELLAEVGLRPGFTASRHDAEWITRHLEADDSPEWMHAYLRGEAACADPFWELLVAGRGLVFGKPLREAAYDVVKATWPDSLALLELSRVGVELDSDLGLITAMIFGRGTELEVQYAMNFADATDAAFLARFAEFDGPRNTAYLRPDSRLVTARPHQSQLPLPSCAATRTRRRAKPCAMTTRLAPPCEQPSPAPVARRSGV